MRDSTAARGELEAARGHGGAGGHGGQPLREDGGQARELGGSGDTGISRGADGAAGRLQGSSGAAADAPGSLPPIAGLAFSYEGNRGTVDGWLPAAGAAADRPKHPWTCVQNADGSWSDVKVETGDVLSHPPLGWRNVGGGAELLAKAAPRTQADVAAEEADALRQWRARRWHRRQDRLFGATPRAAAAAAGRLSPQSPLPRTLHGLPAGQRSPTAAAGVVWTAPAASSSRDPWESRSPPSRLSPLADAGRHSCPQLGDRPGGRGARPSPRRLGSPRRLVGGSPWETDPQGGGPGRLASPSGPALGTAERSKCGGPRGSRAGRRW